MKLGILGAGGHGKVIADIAKSNGINEIFFFDDGVKIKKIFDFEVIDNLKNFNKYTDFNFFPAFGNNEKRKYYFNLIKKNQYKIPTLIHPTAYISSKTIIGIGTVVMPLCVINTGSRISEGCIINTNSTIDHDCKIDKFVHISPGVNLAGNVNIRDESWIGLGSCVKENIKIGKKVIVGAGTVVLKNIPSETTYYNK